MFMINLISQYFVCLSFFFVPKEVLDEYFSLSIEKIDNENSSVCFVLLMRNENRLNLAQAYRGTFLKHLHRPFFSHQTVKMKGIS